MSRRQIITTNIVHSARPEEYRRFLVDNGEDNVDVSLERIEQGMASGIFLETRCSNGLLIGVSAVERVSGVVPGASVARSGMTAVAHHWRGLGLGRFYVASRRIISVLSERDFSSLYYTEIYDTALQSIRNHRTLKFDEVKVADLPRHIVDNLPDKHGLNRQTAVYRGGLKSIEASARYLISIIDHPVRLFQDGRSVEIQFGERVGFGKNAPENLDYVRQLQDLGWRNDPEPQFASYFLPIDS